MMSHEHSEYESRFAPDLPECLICLHMEMAKMKSEISTLTVNLGGMQQIEKESAKKDAIIEYLESKIHERE